MPVQLIFLAFVLKSQQHICVSVE